MIDDKTIDELDAALASVHRERLIREPSIPKARKKRERKHALRHDDGRRRRKTGRTAQFNFKAKPELKEQVNAACRDHDLKIAEFMEAAIEAHLAGLNKRKGK